jgi:hypothetical protein
MYKEITKELKDPSAVIGDAVEEKTTEFSLIDNLEDWAIAENDWSIMKLKDKLGL